MNKDNAVKNMRLDSHKMIFHPKEVYEWMEGKRTYPINMEIGISGACNHRCSFCAFEYLEYRPVFLDKQILLENISDISHKGLKSILIAGFGEPMLHKEAAEIMHEIKNMGIDVALSTNGALFSSAKQELCLRDLSWVRFSVASPIDATYEKIHQCKGGELRKVIENIQYAVNKKEREKLQTTLGIQMVLLPQNIGEVPEMARLGMELGIDYVSIKPFNQGHKIIEGSEIEGRVIEEIYEKAKEYETDKFKVMMRKNLIDQHKMEHPAYDQCGMLEFFCIINADGSVIPCTVFPGLDEFVYGNINERKFSDIWESDRCKAIKDNINKNVFEQYCLSEDCKMRKQNEYLYQLKNPHAHVNFI